MVAGMLVSVLVEFVGAHMADQKPCYRKHTFYSNIFEPLDFSTSVRANQT